MSERKAYIVVAPFKQMEDAYVERGDIVALTEAQAREFDKYIEPAPADSGEPSVFPGADPDEHLEKVEPVEPEPVEPEPAPPENIGEMTVGELTETIVEAGKQKQKGDKDGTPNKRKRRN